MARGTKKPPRRTTGTGDTVFYHPRFSRVLAKNSFRLKALPRKA